MALVIFNFHDDLNYFLSADHRQMNVDDRELAEISRDEQRSLLSRDQGVLKRSLVVYGYYVRQVDAQRQVFEVLQRFGL